MSEYFQDSYPLTLYNFALAFGLCFIVFLPLERLFARHEQSVFRPEWFTDFVFFSGQYLLWTGLVVAVLAALQVYLATVPLFGVRNWVRSLPIWLQIIAVVLLGDFLIYWGHRLSHRIPFLWKFHRVHHTAAKLDWIAAYREHPLDNLYTRIIENAPALLLGFPLEAIAGFAVFRGMWGLFIHSNAKLDLGPFKYVLGSPDLHHWHHDKDRSGTCNFANLMPIMDLLFGSFHDPKNGGQGPELYGIPEKIPHGYVAQLCMPLLPERLCRIIGWGTPPLAKVDSILR